MLARAFYVYRNGLLYDRKVNGISARRLVDELIKQGFTAHYVYVPVVNSPGVNQPMEVK